MSETSDDGAAKAVAADTEAAERTALTAETTAGGEGRVALASAPGARFGRFVVTGALGAGGMGVVMSALDPELDRRVALKLLHPGAGGGVGARARLQREAQAMARLAHPNAVTVFEVGRTGDHLFIAMELVDGTTLRAWLAERARPWRERLATFIAAGRGLEAAHAAGLVHRDFKPENVLIGRDGRPRVSDFGLAESGVEPDDDTVAGADAESSLAVRGYAIGTPSYMAPEQWRGGELDARTDQFAFCVALWTALWQRPPFVGENPSSLRDAVIAGRRRERPAAGEVPSWIMPILDRGLSSDGADRWPSMTALLGALEAGLVTPRRRPWLLGAGVAAALGAAALVVVATRERGAVSPGPAPVDRCPAPTAQLEPLWGAPRQAAVHDHAVAVDPEVGPQRFEAIAPLLDRSFKTWSAVKVEVCRAVPADALATDLRTACLDRWLTSAAAVVDSLGSAAGAGALEAAVVRGASLERPENCADLRALAAAADLPGEPAAHAAALAILDDAKVVFRDARAGAPDVVARADALLVRARALGHNPTLAKALGVRWRIAVSAGDAKGALPFMQETVDVAARSGNDDEAAKTWALMGRVVAEHVGQPDEAKVMIAAARSAAARAGDPPPLVVEVLIAEADVLNAAGDQPGAFAAIARAQQILVAGGADQPGSPDARQLLALLQTEGATAWGAKDLDRAVRALLASIAVSERAFGPDTIDAAGVYLSLAQVYLDRNELEAALGAAEHSLRIRDSHEGQEMSSAMSLSVRAAVLGKLGRHAEAVADAERAATLGRAFWDADDAPLHVILGDLAAAYEDVGRLDEALALYADILARSDRTEVVTANVAGWWLARADLERRLHRCDDARRDYARALEIAHQLEDEGHAVIERAERDRTSCR